MKLAVILPSRGLIFSQTVEELLREVRSLSCPWEIYQAHSQPIPDCFNGPTERALDSDATHFWFVEEDMILPEGILQELLADPNPVTTADYPVNGGMCITYGAQGEVLYAGTGCLLVERRVFDALERPVFDTSRMYRPDGSIIGLRDERELRGIYGQHDIHFYMEVRRLGFGIGVAPSLCGQRRVVEYGQREVNDGFHVIKNL